MTDYWLTFTISNAGYNGRARQQRYADLINAIESMQDTTIFRWEEPTSFIIFRTSRNINEVAQVCKMAIAPPHDVVLIHDVGGKTARVIGKSDEHDTLKAYMSYVQKI